MYKTRTLAAMLLIAFISLPAFLSAQSSFRLAPNQNPRQLESKPMKATVAPYHFWEASPLNQSKRINPAKPVNRVPLATTADGTELWGVVGSASNWTEDYYPYQVASFSAANGLSPKTLVENEVMAANGGGVFYNGKLHVVNWESTGWTYVYAYYTAFDTETWQQAGESVDLGFYNKMLAVSTAYDPVTRKCYGCYHNSPKLNTYEIDVVDYEAQTQDKLCSTDTIYVGFAANAMGQVYAISLGGNLYTVDKTTGATTLVGATGVMPSTSMQSATFDLRTGRLYWAAMDAEHHSALYEVNTTTGRAEKIADFPNDEEILVLYAPAQTDSNAPAAVSDLSIAYDGASLTGTVSFRAPSQSFSGGVLRGQLDYYVCEYGDTLARGKAAVGAQVSCPVTLADGTHKLSVSVANAAGSGPATSITTFAGQDTPKAPTNVTASDADNGVAVSWEPSTEGVNGGYVGTPTYTVKRYPDATTVAEGLTTTSFTDNGIDRSKIQSVYYGITAVAGGKQSEESRSGQIVVGQALEVPFIDDFSDRTRFSLYTVLDRDGNGITWRRGMWDDQLEVSTMNSTTPDDWIFTPPIHLEQGKNYNFAIQAYNGMASTPEKVEAFLCSQPSPEATVATLVQPTELTGKKKTVLGTDFIADHTGSYFFALHDLSIAGSYRIIVDSLAITAGAEATAPDSVRSLTVTADANGEMKATLSFTTPSTAINGSELTSLSQVLIYRNDSLIHTIDNPAVNSSLTWTDEEVKKTGVNKYTVAAANTTGTGQRNSVALYVGLDTPLEPVNVRLADQKNSLRLTWDFPGVKGQHGGVVAEQSTSYNIYDKRGQVVNDGFTAKAQTFPMNTAEGEQQFVYYGVRAYNRAGQSAIVSSPGIVVGAPYTLPLSESFAQGNLSYLWWISSSNENNQFDISTSDAADQDGGCVRWTSLAGDSALFNSGKISLRGAVNPKLVYSYKATPGSDSRLSVVAVRSDGTEVYLRTNDMKTEAKATAQWRQDIVDLSRFANDDYIQLHFVAAAGADLQQISIDNINVRDIYAYDLSTAITAPEQLTAGSTASVSAQVLNIGENAATGYSLTIKADGQVVADTTVSTTLQPMTANNYSFSLPTSVLNTSGKTVWTAEVSYDFDLDETNNVSSATTTLAQPDLSGVQTLTATAQQGAVGLTWTAPAEVSKPVNEDFESYQPWLIDNIGKWTVVDGDKANCYGNQYYQWPNFNKPQAFIVFNPSAIEMDLTAMPTMKPHSGNQSLICFDAAPNAQNTPVQTNDWLISPALPAMAQSISFWAMSIDQSYRDRFELLYSTTDADTASFQRLSLHEDVPAEWTKFEETLPQGTRFFAIHVNSLDKDALALDDIQFVAGSEVPEQYNIYRDGQLIATVPATATTYTDAAAEGDHQYAVTVVYYNGESVPVFASVTTGIAAIEDIIRQQPQDIYTTDGRLVRRQATTVSGLQRGVYVAAGRKFVVK